MCVCTFKKSKLHDFKNLKLLNVIQGDQLYMVTCKTCPVYPIYCTVAYNSVIVKINYMALCNVLAAQLVFLYNRKILEDFIKKLCGFMLLTVVCIIAWLFGIPDSVAGFLDSSVFLISLSTLWLCRSTWSNILYQPTFHNRHFRTNGGHHLQMNL